VSRKPTIQLFALGEEKNLQPLPAIKTTKIDSTAYEVEVSNSQGWFNLLFKQTYSPLWRATIGKKTLSHFKHLENLNGWKVDQEGSFKIKIEYLPQKYFKFGVLCSLVSLLAVLIINLRKSND
jgi:uncharacterized membrane protein YfhO